MPLCIAGYLAPGLSEHIPEDLAELLTKVESVLGLRVYTYNVCSNMDCCFLFRGAHKLSDKCPRCSSARGKQLYYYFSIIDFVRSLWRSKAVVQQIKWMNSRRPAPPPGTISDICDRPDYKELKEEDAFMQLDLQRNMVMDLSCDGFSTTSSPSGPSLWAAMMQIASITPWYRSRPGMTHLVGVPPASARVSAPSWQPRLYSC